MASNIPEKRVKTSITTPADSVTSTSRDSLENGQICAQTDDLQLEQIGYKQIGFSL
jgi:hypothetical protein